MKLTVPGWSGVFKTASAMALLAWILFWWSMAGAGQGLKLSILHMNDPHAHYLPYEEKGMEGPFGGFAKAQTVMNALQERNRAEGRETLRLLAGDLLMGTSFSTAFKGELGVRLMNQMGFAAMTVGNHEFDYGQENLLQKLRPAMSFPLLSANVKRKDGSNVFERVLEKKGSQVPTRIVIFGLTTEETPISTHPGNVEGLVFEDPIKTASDLLANYDDKDLIIALTHIGVDEDMKLAEACPKIDIIVGGHSHTALAPPLKVRDTVIVQAGAYAKFVGQLDLEAVDGKISRYEGRLITLAKDTAEDPGIASVIKEYQSRLDSSLQTVIGRTDVDLEGTRSAIRSGRETNLGKLIAYNMAVNSMADVALINGGAIRAGIPAGPITLNHIYTVLPFGDTVVRIGLLGEDLEAVLRRNVALEAGSGAKLQTFGLTYHVEQGDVKIEKVGSKAFNRAATYHVATNDFLAAGGDGYAVFKEKGKDIWNTSTLLSDIVVDYIKAKKVITEALLQAIPQ